MSMLANAAAHSEVRQRDVQQIVNELRGGGCNARQTLPWLTSDKRLHAVAQRIASGQAMQSSVDAVGYPIAQLSSIHLSGYSETAQLRQLLRAKYCATLLQPDWRQLGIAVQTDDIWIVLATPHTLPMNAREVAQQVLALVNQARSAMRRCGNQAFAATTPLQLNTTLTQAAQLHANDMAQHQRMQHAGSDGSTPAQRVTRQGYRWKTVGENVAAGPGTAQEVVEGWLSSPGHCANIMRPAFREMGLAFAINSHDQYAVYWAQSFASPR